MKLFKLAAFSRNGEGGNPAGVVLSAEPLDVPTMQGIARDVGYSETAFLTPHGSKWRVRYFAPSTEIPFCGHATIGAAAVLGSQYGPGNYDLLPNVGCVPVNTTPDGEYWCASFVSPRTSTQTLDDRDLTRLLACFGLDPHELDPQLKPRMMQAGANHALIALKQRRRLSHIGYSFGELLQLQQELSIATVSIVVREHAGLFHARNPFAIGGVYEDPATGAAAAALAGYLREMRIKPSGTITVVQGEDMGVKCHIEANYEDKPGAGVRVSGQTRPIED